MPRLLLLLLAASGIAAQDANRELAALLQADDDRIADAARTWPDISMAAIEKTAAQDRDMLARLDRIPRARVARENQLLFDTFRRDLRHRLEAFRLRLYLTPYWDDPRFGGRLDFQFFNTARARAGLPPFIDQYIALRAEGARLHMFAPRPTVRATLANLGALPHDAPDAIRKLRDFLTRDYLPLCPDSLSLSQLPGGGEIYGELLRRWTGIDIDPRQAQKLGLSEVARIRAQMAALLPRMHEDRSLDDFLADYRANRRFYFATGDELLAAYHAAIDRIRPLLPRVTSIAVPPLQIEPLRNGGGGVAASYNAAKGAVYVDISRPDIVNRYEVLPLMLHEAIPGHHLQFGAAAHTRATSAGYIEGWGLYAETLGDDLGLFADPYAKFGQLSQQLIRAVRVVVDTSIHLDGWTIDQAKAYFIAQTGKSDTLATAEVSRSFSPGLPPAYTLGQLRFQALRDAGAKREGARFDLVRFHDAILRAGPLPLAILEAAAPDVLRQSR